MGVRLRKIWLAIMVAERGSFSDAAAAMGISQSAASRAIESLEIEFQCALFERRGHSVKTTRQGEILLFRAKRAREQLVRAASEFGETRAEAVFGDMMRASDHECPLANIEMREPRRLRDLSSAALRHEAKIGTRRGSVKI